MDHDAMAVQLRRRTVLGGIGLGALVAGFAPFLDPRAFAAGGDPAEFSSARDQWCTIITGAGADLEDPHVIAAFARLDRSAGSVRDGLDDSEDRVFTDLPFENEVAMRHTYERLVTLASAYRSPGSALHQDPEVRDEILAGLRLTHDVMYHPGHAETGNWWEWEIGAARASMDACALLYDDMPAGDLADYVATIDYFVPDPYYQFLDPARRTESTGANRIDLCRAVLVRGLVGEDAERVTRARDGLSDVFAHVTSGDGIYRDGSFIQHSTVPYTGSYGQVLVDGLSRLLTVLAASPWSVVDPEVQIIFDAIDQGFRPVIYNGQMMDSVRGRSISRAGQTDAFYGKGVIDAILRLADGVQDTDPEAAQRWRGYCKGWLQRLATDPFQGANVVRSAAYTQVLEDAAIEALPEEPGLKIFGSMDRAIHRREQWAYSIAMASTRIAYYECGNGENEQGFHTSNGMTYLYDADGTQFADEFWPTVDLYRLPGITVDSQPLPDRAGGQWGEAVPRSATWTGGATLGDFGAVGMHLQGLDSNLEARKSWFCLDDVVLALGAGITGGSEHPIETVVENRNLHADGEAALVLDGRRQPNELGWAADQRVRWAHLEDVGGYIFPEPQQIQVLREERTGAWSDVNTGGPEDEITRRYLTMWVDHGVQPADARYAYILAPGATSERTRELAARWRARLTILENSAQVQGIRDRDLGLVAVNFWGAGSTDQRSLPPSADGYVNDGDHADTTFGDGNLLLVKHVPAPHSGFSRRSFLTFDLSSADIDDVGSATLRLWARVNDAGGTETDIVVRAVAEPVDETTLTWNNQPELGAELGTVRVDSTFAWRELTLTDEVLARLHTGEHLTVAITQPAGDTADLSVEISSREHPSNGPALRLAPPAGTSEVAGIRTATPCSVVTRTIGDGELRIAISDPTHEQQEVEVEIHAPGFSGWSDAEHVEVERQGPRFLMRVETAGAAGATRLLTLTR